jgi:hypothetical protein
MAVEGAPTTRDRAPRALIAALGIILTVALAAALHDAVRDDLSVRRRPSPMTSLVFAHGSPEACDLSAVYRIAACSAADLDRIGILCVVPIPAAPPDAAPLAPRTLDLSWLGLPRDRALLVRSRLLGGSLRARARAEPDALQVSEVIERVPPGAVAVTDGVIRDIELDPTHVWIASDDGIFRVRRQRGAFREPIGPAADALQLDGDGVVFTSSGRLLRTRPQQAQPEVLLEGGYVSSFAVDGRTVFLYRMGEGTLRAVSLEGGPERVIAEVKTPPRIAVDATHVYWTDHFGARVRRAPKEGGDAADVQELVNAGPLVATKQRLVWASWIQGMGEVWSTPAGGGALQELAFGQSIVEGLSAGGGAVAWTVETPHGRASRVARGGELLGTGEIGTPRSSPQVTVVDDADLYVAATCLGTQAVFRVPLPAAR